MWSNTNHPLQYVLTFILKSSNSSIVVVTCAGIRIHIELYTILYHTYKCITEKNQN